MIGIIELLSTRGLDFTKSVKFVRHKDKRCDIFQLIYDEYFETYQAFQNKSAFNCDYVVSFLGLSSTMALFFKVYKVMDVQDPQSINLPEGFPFQNFKNDSEVYYDLKELPEFNDLSKRVVIDWGKGALAWIQNSKEKEVIQIYPCGYFMDFPGYLNFVLTFKELELIYNFPDANSVWINKLSSTFGIYMILDTETGNQYIGSAYGTEGIWGRWKTYIKTGHGNNQKLKELLAQEKYKYNFQFTILQTLPSNLNVDEVVKYENLYKTKFGSRVFGLNSSEKNSK
jgi:hypothetical protein